MLPYLCTGSSEFMDLKPENILITHNGQNVKIIDFGLSDTDDYYIHKDPAGTRVYASPEQLNGQILDAGFSEESVFGNPSGE